MQDALPYRQASLGDFFADFAGAASYFLLRVIFTPRKKNPHG
jgi:hypothetical protein